ncbi:FAD-dependent monooxygenase [Streptomyces niveus]|uniref:FAD-dependent monooxygenase n=1 Tax=Streptomyces niveus TaxID=193462 RepID=UPI0036D84E60
MDTDVIIVGAGPTGLMLACELRLAGVRPLVLERQPHRRDTPKAGGLGGQILELLRYRGLLERCEAACTGPAPAPRFPFGGVHVDLTGLADPPMHALPLPQPQLEKVLDERAGELGVEIRRGHQVVGVVQDESSVTAEVLGPDGPYEATARFLSGCDGARSRVRDAAGVAFPGTTYPEVNRLAQVTLPDTVAVLDNGDLDVAGFGTVHGGFPGHLRTHPRHRRVRRRPDDPCLHRHHGPPYLTLELRRRTPSSPAERGTAASEHQHQMSRKISICAPTEFSRSARSS